MANFHRGHAIDASYQASVHLAKQFQRKIFFRIDQPEKKIACGSRLYSNRDEMRKLYKGPSIDAAYQVSIHLAQRF